METSEIVQRAIDYKEASLYEPLSLDNIAEAAVMSIPNLYRLFNAMTEHPLKE
jgi:AraC-like DNA-binding protein